MQKCRNTRGNTRELVVIIDHYSWYETKRSLRQLLLIASNSQSIWRRALCVEKVDIKGPCVGSLQNIFNK